MENGSDAIVSIDEESRIIYANRAVERVLGHDPEQLVGERVATVVPERFHGDHFAALKREWADTEFEPETPAPSA